MNRFTVFLYNDCRAFETYDGMTQWLDDVITPGDTFTIAMPENDAWLQLDGNGCIICATYVTHGWRFVTIYHELV